MFTFHTITTTCTFTIMNQENSSIYNVLNNNSSKKRRMINQLRDISIINSFYKFVFIASLRLSLRINFSSNFFNLTKNNIDVAKTTLRRKHDVRIKNLNSTINHEY